MASSSHNSEISINAEKEVSIYAEKDEYWRYIPLYKAALRGDWETAERFFNQDEGSLTARISKFSDTALHISVSAGPNTINFVKKLVEKMPLETLEIGAQFNATALHNAAFVGNLQAAKVLVEKNPSLLYLSDHRKYLPLHLAAMNAHKDTLLYLLDVTKFDQVSELFNDEAGAHFIYLVIGSGFYDVALDLIHKYPSFATMYRDDDDSCALIAIARKETAFPSSSHHNFWQRIVYAHVPVKLKECIKNNKEGDIEDPVSSSQVPMQKYNRAQLLMEYFSIHVPCIKNIQEQKKMHVQALQLVKCICTTIRSLNDSNAYELLAKDALHTAAYLGFHEVIEEIVESFPSVVWSRDQAGFNVFQRAVIERNENVFNLLFQMSEHKQAIIQLKDNFGNNLLHLAGNLGPPSKLNLVSGAALQMQRELQWFQEVKKFGNPNAMECRNAAHETPAVVFTEKHKDLVVEGEKWMKEKANSCTIPTTLIATVVFAAIFTVPDGSTSASGVSNLSKQLAINIFLVFDAISMFTSSTSLLMLLSILTSNYGECEFLFVLPNRLIIALVTLFLSITTMVVAFSSALYLVLVSGRINTPVIVPVVALASLPIISFASLQFPLLVDLMASTYGPGIFGKQSDRPFH